jgi:hypothetical protein
MYCISTILKMLYLAYLTGILIVLHGIKVIMGKDQNGIFHPAKGKPSGANKEEGLGFTSTPPEKLDEYLNITDKYTTGPDELAEGVPLRHPNRNTSKNEETKNGYNANQ